MTGKRNLVLRGQSGGFESELKPGDLMESEKEFPEFNRNLYPSIEPYSSGFLKVSDIHTIYWEQSGNPNGHVSAPLPMRFGFFKLLCFEFFFFSILFL